MEQEAINRPWLSHYDPEIKANLEYTEAAVQLFLERSAAEHPNRSALVFQNSKISYAQLNAAAERVAANLQGYGLQKGDRVALMLPNLPQLVISYWGILKAGGVVVMTNPLYMEKEILHQFGDAQPRILITLDRLWPKIDPLRERLQLEKYFITSISDALSFPLNILSRWQKDERKHKSKVSYHQEEVLPWKKLLAKGRQYQRPSFRPKKDLALLQYTGGTTGMAKGVMLSHFNLRVNVCQCMEMLHDIGKRQEIFLGLLPFFHVYGLTVSLNLPTAIAATIIPQPQYTPADIFKCISQNRPTIFPSAPAIFNLMLQKKSISKYDFSSIRYCISGSAALPVELVRKFKELTGVEIVEGYGLTEASPVTHLNPLSGKRKPGSIGLPFPDTDALIVDMKKGEQLLPPGEIGELIIRGPQVMLGYWGKEEDTRQSLRNGWLYTGDLGYMDAQGYFYIVDRKKELIVTSGYNVYPREVDEVLQEHPQVATAVCIGLPHKTRGESIKAFIVPNPGEVIDKNEIMTYCRQKLANYKLPRQIEFRSQLPKSGIGKILRRKLQEEELQKIKKRKELEKTRKIRLRK